MKTRLLRRFIRKASHEISITSITSRGCINTGMSYNYSDNRYSGIFSFGDSEDDVMRKVRQRYWDKIRDRYYKKYGKYRRCKQQ